MLTFKVKCLFILSLTIGMISCQKSSPCKEKKTCDSCLGTAGCTWCEKKSLSEIQRCNTLEDQKDCPAADIVKAGESIYNIVREEPIMKTNENPMRIKPQEIYAKLSVGQEVIIDLMYQDGTDKELDLYYIMDLSATMEDDKKTVSEQAHNLVQELQQITKNVRLGFGSFIDKPVLPFVSSSQLREDNDAKYEKPYGFRNGLNLTDKWQDFKRVVEDARISRNLDEPEGTLDALMQAITCTKEIGWRNTSRKLIVVATDGPFHIAGDGKLGGIVRPNDMTCHMKNNEYTHSTLLDYPSIGEINAVILQHKVYVIFAVSEGSSGNVFNIYRELQSHITQSTAEKLEKDSSNVVKKIRTKYLEISKKVELEKTQLDNVDVEVLAKCPGEKEFKRSHICTDVGVDKTVEFKIKLVLKKCPDLQAYHRSNRDSTSGKIIVSFFELGQQEKLTINLDYNCKCPCNEPNKHINDSTDLSTYCNGQASKYMACGVCHCQNQRFGHACQCSENDPGDDTNCKNPVGDINVPCSGSNRGTCICGRCECLANYNGEFCQSSTLDCQNDKSKPNVLCSDYKRGACKNGSCHCNEGYEGQFCQCEKSRKHLCVEPGQEISESAICNGHGTCNCDYGQCQCHYDYTGRYCEVCKICTGDKLSDRCQDEFLQDCVRCHVVRQLEPKSGNLTVYQECRESCNGYSYKGKSSSSSRVDVENLEVQSSVSLSEIPGTQCRLWINASCYNFFKYTYVQKSHGDRDDLKVFYTTEGILCEKEPPIIWIIVGGILTVLLVGIFGLLIWKLATHLHDAREFKRFEQETALARFQAGENPLYETPKSEFQNPAYRE